MKLLAIDTSTLTSSAAVVQRCDGEPLEVLAHRDGGVRTHSDSIVSLIEAVLADSGTGLADVDAVAVGAGPGSFTGLRIGMSTAKGLAFAAGKPLWAVSSLAALASDFLASEPASELDPLVVAVLDARRQEVFAGSFCNAGEGVARSLGPERVIAPDALSEQLSNPDGRPVIVVGDALELYQDALSAVGHLATGARPTPSAIGVARMALSGDRADALHTASPVYIRPSEAERKFPNGNPGGTFSRPK